MIGDLGTSIVRLKKVDYKSISGRLGHKVMEKRWAWEYPALWIDD